MDIQHRNTAIKGDIATYTYSVDGKNVSFSLPLQVVVMGVWLVPLAIHTCFHSQGTEAVKEALDSHYALLHKEGYNSKLIREQDIVFYKKAIAALS